MGPWRNHQCLNFLWFMWWFNYSPETSAARCIVLLSGCSSVGLVGRTSKSDLGGRATSFLIISWDSWLYQIWFGQSGVTNIPTALSFHIFCITLAGMHIKVWKAYFCVHIFLSMFLWMNPQQYIWDLACMNDINFWSWVYADKSTVRINPNFWTTNLKSCLFNVHSVLNSCCLRSFVCFHIENAWNMSCRNESQLFFEVIQCHILFTTWSISKDCMWLGITHVIYGSSCRGVIKLMWESLTLSHNDLNLYSATFILRY